MLMRTEVLSKALNAQASLARKSALVLAGSLFIALAAQVSVPFFPVPMTLQTLAILVIGLTYGSRLGAVTLMAYLAEGAIGLPVFANGMNGAALMGPTAGFLFGFVGMAWLAGLAVERGLARGLVQTSLVGIVISGLLYLPGLAWPALVMGKTWSALWSGWMAPFLVGDAVKAVLAAMIVAGIWNLVKSRKA